MCDVNKASCAMAQVKVIGQGQRLELLSATEFNDGNAVGLSLILDRRQFVFFSLAVR